MTAILTPAQLALIDDALRSNSMFLAIRTYREFTGASLADASAFVRARGESIVEEPMPELVQQFLASSFSRKGELVGWWRERSGLPCTLVLFQRTPQPVFEASLIEGPVFGHQVHGYTCSLAEVLAAAGSETGFRNMEWGEQGFRMAERIRTFAAGLLAAASPKASSRATAFYLLDAVSFERDYLFHPQTVDGAWWAKVRAAARSNARLDEALEEIAGEPTTLPPGAGRIVLELCLADCARSTVRTEATDQFFADLEATPPDWRSLSPAAGIAWEYFLSAVGLSGPPRVDLPWWAASVRGCSSAAVGLLPPPQVRLVARFADELRGIFGGNGDAGLLLDLVASASREGAWVMGVEPTGS